MAVNDNLLLYIEPKNPPSKLPVIDELTCTMAHALKLAKSGTVNYSSQEAPYEFNEGNGWRGWHNCSCGINAGNKDYLLPNGEFTNKLCVHYLAYHRDEISEEQLKRVDACSDDADLPTVEQLMTPKGSVHLDSDGIVDAFVKQQLEREFPKPKPSPYGDKTWAVGFKDRGHGHRDFGVIDEEGNIVTELPLTENDRGHAHLIVAACNHHKELISMVEDTIKMLNSDYIPNAVSEISVLEERLSKIKELTI